MQNIIALSGGRTPSDDWNRSFYLKILNLKTITIAENLNIIVSKNVWINAFQPSVSFHIETGHWFSLKTKDWFLYKMHTDDDDDEFFVTIS